MSKPKMSLGYSFANMNGFGQNFKLKFWVEPGLGKHKIY